jgi:copper chaperone CopZ
MTIQREVGELAGVASVEADQESKRVTVSWDPDATDWATIEGLMKEINYPPAP